MRNNNKDKTYIMARSRKSKSALNQTKVFVNQEDVEKMEEFHNIDMIDEVKHMAAEEFGVEKEDIEVEMAHETREEFDEIFEKELEKQINIETESPELEDDGEEDDETEEEIVDTKPTKEQLMSLSKAGYRYYQRTGKLPK